MRYRPFAHSGTAVSALSLILTDTDRRRAPQHWRGLVQAAFEVGVNTFEFHTPSDSLLEGFAEAAEPLERRLIFVGLRVAGDRGREAMTASVDHVIARTGLGSLDLLTIEASGARSAEIIDELRTLKVARRARRIAVAGDADATEDLANSGLFDALVTPFNLLSGWRERRLIRAAGDRQLAIIGSDPFPAETPDLIRNARQQQKKGGWFVKREALAGVGSYRFLADTPGWTAEQICLGYALTEPSLASVQMHLTEPKLLPPLAAITERDLPPAIGAQIEMARFSAEQQGAASRRSA